LKKGNLIWMGLDTIEKYTIHNSENQEEYNLQMILILVEL
jgi:hypothetical protein